jgi:hypothetical protein
MLEDGEDPARGAHLGEHIGPAVGEPEPNEVGGVERRHECKAPSAAQ